MKKIAADRNYRVLKRAAKKISDQELLNYLKSNDANAKALQELLKDTGRPLPLSVRDAKFMLSNSSWRKAVEESFLKDNPNSAHLQQQRQDDPGRQQSPQEAKKQFRIRELRLEINDLTTELSMLTKELSMLERDQRSNKRP